MENYLEDIKKYDPSPNETVAEKIARNLRLVMTHKDARYVAVTEKGELDVVVKNFAMEKLGVSKDKAEIAVNKVAEIMHKDHQKSRITFYYLVAKELNKFSAIV